MSKSLHYRDDDAIKAFGKRVRELREKKGLTIEEFANSSEIHVTQVSRIERGESNVSLSYITLLASKLNVQVKDLFP